VSALAAQDLLEPEQRIAWLDERRSALGAKYDKFGNDEAGAMHIALMAAMAIEASPNRNPSTSVGWWHINSRNRVAPLRGGCRRECQF
jgi:hypothetical protein